MMKPSTVEVLLYKSSRIKIPASDTHPKSSYLMISSSIAICS